MEADVRRLSDAFPLGGAWKAPEVVREVLDVGGRPLQLVGLACETGGGPTVTSGAAGWAADVLDRGWFELLERTAVLAARSGELGESRTVWTRTGAPCGALPLREIFPAAPDAAGRRHSLSNGVAAHTDAGRARESGFLECVERDRVLRSWYGAAPPPEPVPDRTPALDALADRFDVDVRRFVDPEDPETGVHAVAVFLLPRAAGDPLCTGFAADRTRGRALRRAEIECLQRLGFLSGEPLPDAPPEPTPTPDFHLDFYLHPPHHGLLRRWLDGERPPGRPRVDAGPRDGEARFVDLTPPHLEGRVAVAKAIVPGRLPLVFGEGHPQVTGAAPETRVHPIA